MRAMLGLALAVVLGCSHETKPTVQPDDHPPLPPASGTPIGYLIDDASELALRDEQLTRLKAIDSELSDRLAVLDGQQRGGHPRARAADAASTGRHRGGRRGGMGGAGAGGGGAGGGMGGRGGRGRRASSGSGSGSANASANAGAAAGATNERASNVHDALKRAFALLDPHQREIATRVLSDHGVDVDTDHPGQAGEPGEPGEPGEGDQDAEPPSTGSDGK